MRFWILLPLILLTSCAQPNKFEIYYQPIVYSKAIENQNIEPKVVETLDIDKKLTLFKTQGYQILGSSYFNGAWEARFKAIDFAKKIGASLVLVTADFTGTSPEVNFIHVPTVDSATQSGDIDLGYGSAAVFSATTTTHGIQQVASSFNIGQYEQNAFFLIKDLLGNQGLMTDAK